MDYKHLYDEEKLNKLLEEIEEVKQKRDVAIGFGDFSENSELKSANVRLDFLSEEYGRLLGIKYAIDKMDKNIGGLANKEIVEGSIIKVRILQADVPEKKKTWRVVNQTLIDLDTFTNFIAIDSELVSVLRRAGEGVRIEYKTPDRRDVSLFYEIIKQEEKSR